MCVSKKRLIHLLTELSLQQKCDNLPLASLHSGEQTTTAQRERRRSEQPPPTDGVDCLERKFTTAPAEEQTTPFPLLHNMSRQKPGSAAESVSQALPHRLARGKRRLSAAVVWLLLGGPLTIWGLITLLFFTVFKSKIPKNCVFFAKKHKY